jgi:hypothetical protein
VDVVYFDRWVNASIRYCTRVAHKRGLILSWMLSRTLYAGDGSVGVA